ncbi:MAG: SRPBCC family protein, partial [Actinomycetes bacterium]
DEDWSIIERMHAGSRSSGFSRALLSRRMEKNINGFQALVVDHAGLPDHQ